MKKLNKLLAGESDGRIYFIWPYCEKARGPRYIRSIIKECDNICGQLSNEEWERTHVDGAGWAAYIIDDISHADVEELEEQFHAETEDNVPVYVITTHKLLVNVGGLKDLSERQMDQMKRKFEWTGRRLGRETIVLK